MDVDMDHASGWGLFHIFPLEVVLTVVNKLPLLDALHLCQTSTPLRRVATMPTSNLVCYQEEAVNDMMRGKFSCLRTNELVEIPIDEAGIPLHRHEETDACDCTFEKWQCSTDERSAE